MAFLRVAKTSQKGQGLREFSKVMRFPKTLLPSLFLASLLALGVEPEFEIRRAIPIELDVVPQFLTPELEALPRILPEKVQTTYTRCQVPGNVIAVTFDDGPHAEFTPRLLDTLKERNIKATFFMVGRNATAYPHIVKRMQDEGHEVANHTWAHPLLTGYGAEGVKSQLKRTHDAIEKACGTAPILYRPPYGGARLTQRRSIMQDFGYPTILWDVDPLDWQSPRSVQKVYDRVLSMTKPGSIVLLHDIHETTVNAMPATLDALIERGYQMVTVTQLINLEAQNAPVVPAVAAEEPKPLPVQVETEAGAAVLATEPPVGNP
jgi:peptidoglycan/xylan/chitin deacetylase (PgdA/CDA1 family)